MSHTPNLKLETIAQNAKQLSPQYNESMQSLDVIVQLITQAILNAPPTTADPADLGKRWIVGTTPTGAWVGHAGDIAYCTGANLWEFYTPQLGWFVQKNLGDNTAREWTGSAWVVSTAGTLAAAAVTYDHTASGLAATDVQDALDEIKAEVDAIPIVGQGTTVTALSIVSGVVTINLALGDLFTLALNANVTSVVFINPPGAGKGQAIAIRVQQDGTGSRTLALPSSFKATGGSDLAIASAANAYTIISATTFDNGTRWEYAMQEGAA